MTRTQALKEAKKWTMACWWPSKVMGKRTVDLGGVVNELIGLRNAARDYRHEDTTVLNQIIKTLVS